VCSKIRNCYLATNLVSSSKAVKSSIVLTNPAPDADSNNQNQSEDYHAHELELQSFKNEPLSIEEAERRDNIDRLIARHRELGDALVSKLSICVRTSEGEYILKDIIVAASKAIFPNQHLAHSPSTTKPAEIQNNMAVLRYTDKTPWFEILASMAQLPLEEQSLEVPPIDIEQLSLVIHNMMNEISTLLPEEQAEIAEFLALSCIIEYLEEGTCDPIFCFPMLELEHILDNDDQDSEQDSEASEEFEASDTDTEQVRQGNTIRLDGYLGTLIDFEMEAPEGILCVGSPYTLLGSLHGDICPVSLLSTAPEDRIDHQILQQVVGTLQNFDHSIKNVSRHFELAQLVDLALVCDLENLTAIEIKQLLAKTRDAVTTYGYIIAIYPTNYTNDHQCCPQEVIEAFLAENINDTPMVVASYEDTHPMVAQLVNLKDFSKIESAQDCNDMFEHLKATKMLSLNWKITIVQKVENPGLVLVA
jgi:hypothetical protein